MKNTEFNKLFLSIIKSNCESITNSIYSRAGAMVLTDKSLRDNEDQVRDEAVRTFIHLLSKELSRYTENQINRL